MIELSDVHTAAERLAGVAHRTPVLTSRTLDKACGARVFLKPECFQRTGSFKFRGAYNRLAALAPDERARGVAAYSSGNHAQAVALAASLLGTTAVILMPEDTPVAKREATEGYGAEVITYDRYKQDRVVLGTDLANERGMTLVPPYDHPLVMAGQGTAALELVEDAGTELDVLVTPVGGGGLIAGCATAAKGTTPSIAVVGVEPDAGDDTKRSVAAGARVQIDVPQTIADGLQSNTPGELTFPVVQKRVDEIVTVPDDALVAAMVFAADRLKVLLEPSGAIGLAALLSGALDVQGRKVGVVLSGGNVGAARFAALVTRVGGQGESET